MSVPDNGYIALLVAVSAGITWALRALPFAVLVPLRQRAAVMSGVGAVFATAVVLGPPPVLPPEEALPRHRRERSVDPVDRHPPSEPRELPDEGVGVGVTLRTAPAAPPPPSCPPATWRV